MKKFSIENLKQLLGLIKTLVSTTKTEITEAYEALVGALGNDKNGQKHTVKSYVDESIEKVNGDNTALAARVTANEGAISTINGDASTEGSFKKYFADMWDNLTKSDGGTIDKLNEIVAWFKDLATTDAGAVALLNDVAANKTAVTTTLPNAIAKAQEDAEAHADEVAGTAETNAKSYADGIVSTLENGQVKTNKEDIAAINNTTTGILAQAKADATSKANTAEANAKAYADQQIEAIAAYTESEISAAWNEVFTPAAA